jgi:23S rRNA (cytosine1962-C5)-methyltransferase
VNAVASVRLKPGRERSLDRRHPWIFSGAVDRVRGDPVAGATVRIESSEGRFLAWAAYSAQSQIRARAWSYDEDAVPDTDWLSRRIRQAIDRRQASEFGSDALRLVHGESDGVPGLIVDRYADLLVVQVLSAGVEARREEIAATLCSATGLADIYERSDADVRALEGLPERAGWIRGGGRDPCVEIRERGLAYQVDVALGQKTGFYLDQRDNRASIGGLSAARDVLNAFCYTGGFTLSALRGGARSVLSIDSSGPALAIAQRNADLNGLSGPAARWQEADVFATLRKLRDAGHSFDLIVLDPPKFAPTARQAESASRGYKDINMNAMKLLRPGGLLATFSCSGGISNELFQKIVAGAAADARVSATLLQRFQAAADHPVRIEFPEGEYLKGLLLRREA